MTVAKKVIMGSGAVDAYEIEQSIILDSASSSKLVRQNTSAGNKKTFTISVWVKRGKLGKYNAIFGGGASTGSSTGGVDAGLIIQANDTWGLSIQGNVYNAYATQKLRDVGAWYHLVAMLDTTQAVEANRFKLYKNGVEVEAYTEANTGFPAQNVETAQINKDDAYHQISGLSGYDATDYFFDGYLAELNFIDGIALDPSSFGKTNSDTGQWIPKKYSGSYGTNGFYLKFASGAIGTDSSGEGNNYTASNLANSDVVIDTPTNNFATLNPLPSASSAIVMSQGNLHAVQRAGGITNGQQNVSTIAMPAGSGKWYFEMYQPYSGLGYLFGITPTSENPTLGSSGNLGYNQYNASGGKQYATESRTDYGTAWYTSGQTYIISCYYDSDNGKIGYYMNGTDQGFAFTDVVAGTYFASYRCGSGGTGSAPTTANFGQNGTFGGAVTAQGNADTNGIGDFYYAPPSGYKALCTANLPDPAIPLPEEQFNTVLYTGNNADDRTITTGMQSDFVWIKTRNAANNHNLFDKVRGVGKAIYSNATDAESTRDDSLTAFLSTGFTIDQNAAYNDLNGSDHTYVAWNWKANGSGSTNTVGSLDSVVSANAAAGFSIVTYTGNGSAQSIGHGLSKDLELIFLKNREATSSWVTQWVGNPLADYMYLNDTRGQSTTTIFNLDITRSNDGTFHYGVAQYLGANNIDYVAYCFHSVAGYSKIGEYTGNGNADGPFINCGFRPAFFLLKRTTDTGDYDWFIVDNKRDTSNVVDLILSPNLSGAEASATSLVDFVSNGVKVMSSSAAINTNGATFLYMAFAESPFKTANAR